MNMSFCIYYDVTYKYVNTYMYIEASCKKYSYIR